MNKFTISIIVLVIIILVLIAGLIWLGFNLSDEQVSSLTNKISQPLEQTGSQDSGSIDPGSLDYCQAISGVSRDFCFRDLAIKENNISYCDEISNQRTKESCEVSFNSEEE